ncbi:MAG: PhoX family phosphatase, partial [Deltaproteobacteria bacterium]|nr:PhoX family phosphatase [Deltaproteobacteria bacterium]
NADFIGYIPLADGPAGGRHGLLCCNHEFANGVMMFPGFSSRDDARNHVDENQCGVEMAALGHSVVEIRKEGATWRVVEGPYNRRISLKDTEIAFSGPVAGHPRLQTRQDPTGTRVQGTLANCSGGVTPWGTVLICEENINYFFDGPAPEGREKINHQRYGITKPSRYPYYRFDERFRVAEHPNEPNRFGWVVEIDPKNPQSMPVKRTSLGRFLREAAQVVIDKSGRVVIYSGDDSYFEYLYRWVSDSRYEPHAPESNKNILDSGTLSVAKCEEDGRLVWIPLIYGRAGLTPGNGFHSQADVLLEARRAADISDATPMDRPEDVEVSPVTGRVYAMLTKNKKRSTDTDGVNSRAKNHYGQVLEMIPPGPAGDVSHIADEFQWEVFLLGGNPEEPEHGARFHPSTQPDDILANPDNATFDAKGRLWISSDGAESSLAMADGLWVCETQGEERALLRRFAAVPKGAELSGPCFASDEETLFIAVQHPGADWETTYAQPTCRWPDFREDMPPRSAVVAITRRKGGRILD